MPPGADRIRPFAAGAAVALVALVPVVIAALSPLQAGRTATWIAGGMAGVVALSLFFVQPLLASGGWLQGRAGPRVARVAHRIVGYSILTAVIVHVGGLYLYSPDDILDALTLASPTPFSIYGVASAALVLLVVAIAALGRRVHRHALAARMVHSIIACLAVIAGAVHAWMIDGAMGVASKFGISAAAVATVLVVTAIAIRRWLRRESA